MRYNQRGQSVREKVFNSIRSSGIDVFLKELSSSTQAFTKIQEDFGILVFKEDLVSPYFIYSTIECKTGHGLDRSNKSDKYVDLPRLISRN